MPKIIKTTKADLDARVAKARELMAQYERAGDRFSLADLGSQTGPSEYWMFGCTYAPVRRMLRDAQNLQSRLGCPTKSSNKTVGDRRRTYRRPEPTAPDWVWELWEEACLIGWPLLAARVGYSAPHLHNAVSGLRKFRGGTVARTAAVQAAWDRYKANYKSLQEVDCA